MQDSIEQTVCRSANLFLLEALTASLLDCDTGLWRPQVHPSGHPRDSPARALFAATMLARCSAVIFLLCRPQVHPGAHLGRSGRLCRPQVHPSKHGAKSVRECFLQEQPGEQTFFTRDSVAHQHSNGHSSRWHLPQWREAVTVAPELATGKQGCGKYAVCLEASVQVSGYTMVVRTYCKVKVFGSVIVPIFTCSPSSTSVRTQFPVRMLSSRTNAFP